MLNAGRYYGGSGGRQPSAVMPSSSKDRQRVVNGGGAAVSGFVNRCEQVLDDKNEMVVTATRPTVVGHDEYYQPGMCYKKYAYLNLKIIEQLSAKTVNMQNMISDKDDKIMKLTQDLELYKEAINEANEKLAKLNAKKVTSDELPSTPLPNAYSSVVVSLSPSVQCDKQEVKTKTLRTRIVVNKKTISDTPKFNQTKQRRSRITQAKSDDEGKIQDVLMVTDNNDYYTCLGDYDSVKDDTIPEKKNSVLEIPSWRIVNYSSWYTMEGTENMSDESFENRHQRLEKNEKKRKRWDLQNLREMKRVEYLKARHNGQNKNNEEELTTLLPNPSNIKAIEVTNNLPVSAFGCNLHVKKNSAPFKLYHNKWCHDGSRMPDHNNVRGLRSSSRNHLFDCYAQ